MKTCEECGKVLEEGSAFCGYCGTPVKQEEEQSSIVYCGNCGQPLEEGSAFCGNCGYKVDNALIQESEEDSMQQEYTKNQAFNSWNEQPVEMYSSKKKKKKSKKAPIIISIVVVLVLLLGLGGGYAFLTYTEQKKAEEKYSELEKFIDDNNVKLTEAMEDGVDKLGDDLDTFNYFELKKIHKKVEKELEEIKNFDKQMDDAEATMRDYNDELAGYNTAVQDMNEQYQFSYYKEDCEDALDKFQQYIDDRKVKEFADAQKSAREYLDTYKEELAEVAEDRIDELKEDYDKFSGYKEQLDKDAGDKKVAKDEGVKTAKTNLETALKNFNEAINNSKFDMIYTYREEVNTDLFAYEEAIGTAVAAKVVITVNYESDLEYIIPYGLTDIIDEDYFDQVKDLTATDKLKLCILARNGIYASYGVHFNAGSLNKYFSNRTWYYDFEYASDDEDITRFIQQDETSKTNLETLNKLQKKYEQKYGKTDVKATEFKAKEYEKALETFNLYRKVAE